MYLHLMYTLIIVLGFLIISIQSHEEHLFMSHKESELFQENYKMYYSWLKTENHQFTLSKMLQKALFYLFIYFLNNDQGSGWLMSGSSRNEFTEFTCFSPYFTHFIPDTFCLLKLIHDINLIISYSKNGLLIDP